MLQIVGSILSLCGVVGAIQGNCIPPQPPLRETPLLVSWYDPALGGVNCGGSCDHLSLTEMDEGLYGHVAACPAELVGLDVTAVISHPAIGIQHCLDRGGAIEFKYGYLEGVGWLWYGVIDLLAHEQPPATWTLITDWGMTWESPGSIVGRLVN